MSETADITAWVADLRWEDLPLDIVRQTKRCLRDFLACLAGGARSEPGRISAELALHWHGPREATLIGTSEHVAARHAAFAHATMANALDYDDTYFGHHGSTTFPVVLAAAEKWRCTGREFLLAAVAGYEIGVRAMALLDPLIPRYRAMWDLGTLQAFGAVVAAAKLAGLDQQGIANALGIITGTSPVPLPRKQRYPGEGRSMLKSAYGWAADAAIVAAELTRAGFTGPGYALDDNMGFWTSCSSDLLGISSFSEGLGQAWAIVDVAFKPYMACRFIHPVLQGVEEIINQHPITPSDIKRVEIRSFSLLADEHHYILQPVSGTDAQFSVPYTVAALLYEGGLTPETYENQMLQNPDILELAKRIVVEVEPEFDTAYPGRLSAHVRIVTHDGHIEETTVRNPKGSPNQPLTDAILLNKLHTLADPLLGRGQVNEITAVVEELENLPGLEPLVRLLSAV